MRILDAPYQPARIALEVYAAPAHGRTPPAGQPQVCNLLARLDEYTQRGTPLSAAEADAWHADVRHAVELLLPLDVADADEHKRNAERRAWLQRAWELAAGHLDI